MKSAFVCVVLLGVSSAHAGALNQMIVMKGPCAGGGIAKFAADPNCYRIASVVSQLDAPVPVRFQPEPAESFTLQETPPSDGAGPELPGESVPGIDPSIGGGGIGDIVNTFKWVWAMVEKYKAVYNEELEPYASGLPRGVKDASDLDQWQMPKHLPAKLVAKNVYGLEVVRITYTVDFVYGGRLNNHGRYLTNVTVVPHSVAIAWGFETTLTGKALAVLNFGTHKDPVAGIQLLVGARIKSLNTMQAVSSFLVRGDGGFEEVRPDLWTQAVNVPKPANPRPR